MTPTDIPHKVIKGQSDLQKNVWLINITMLAAKCKIE